MVLRDGECANEKVPVSRLLGDEQRVLDGEADRGLFGSRPGVVAVVEDAGFVFLKVETHEAGNHAPISYVGFLSKYKDL